jgi:hypothetical protein
VKIRIEHGTVVAWRHGRHEIVDDGAVLIDGSSIVAVVAPDEVLAREDSQADQVLGAMAPIVLTSRADSLEARIASVALASLAARH